LSMESIRNSLVQAGTIYVKIPEWVQHSANNGMQCLVSVFATFPVT
jgi:hypothetical protein